MENNISADITDLTATGGIIGTLAYMAPERFDTVGYDGRSDIYSAGVVLYRALCGRLSFQIEGVAKNVLSLHVQQLMQEPPPLISINADIPAPLAALVTRAIAKRPEHRPTARELAAELSAFTQQPAHAVNISPAVLYIGTTS